MRDETTQAVFDAAWHVLENAYGTTPRHTRGRDGGCRDDCIPCGLDGLRHALSVADPGNAMPWSEQMLERPALVKAAARVPLENTLTYGTVCRFQYCQHPPGECPVPELANR